MPAGDGHTAARLLRENEESARLSMFGAAGVDPPAALRAFTHAAEAGGRIWTLTAVRSGIGAVDPMAQLLEISRAVRDDYASGLWPGPGPADGRLMSAADNFDRAARQLPDGPAGVKSAEPRPGARDWRSEVRLRVMHTLYLEAHGLRVALNLHAADLARQLERDSLRRTPLQRRIDLGDPAAAAAMADRLDLVERLAGQYLHDHRRPASPTTPGLSSGLSPELSLALPAALARWDIEAHRALAAFPTSSNVVCVARVQALITTAAGVVAEAAAASGGLERAACDRFLPRADAAQLAWTQTARRWSELTTPAGQTHPPLLGAADELRTALAAAIHTDHGWAAPEVVARRVDLDTTVQALHLALAGGTDLSHVIHRVAATEPTLTAPARTISMRTQGEVERAADRGETRYLDVEWVSQQQMRTNQLIALPDPARHGLVDLAAETTATATRAQCTLVLPIRRPAPEPPCPPSTRVRIDHGRGVPSAPTPEPPGR